jgi:NADH:ubiquinone oxidoreductase subunit 3 (subunit A)
MRLTRPGFSVRRLMALILYIAFDCAAFYNATWHDSNKWLLVFLMLTLLGPLILVIWWAFRRMDWSLTLL